MVKKKPTTAPASATSPQNKKGARARDTSLAWVERSYPQLAAWRALAVKWLKGETSGLNMRLAALVAFLERYLIEQGLPLDPAVFLARTTVLPDFYRSACPDSISGIEYNNCVHAFLRTRNAVYVGTESGLARYPVGVHVLPQTAGFGKNGLGLQVGGGVDYRIYPHLSARAELDWVGTHLFGAWQNSAQANVDIVLHF